MGFLEFFTEHFIKTPIDYNTWMQQLSKKGWEKKGEGAYGVAYVHPNKNYIYKIFKSDPGYEFFLDFVLKNQNDRAVVKLKRVVLTGMETEAYLHEKSVPNVIVLEKLKPLDINDDRYEILFNASHAILGSINEVYKEGMSFEEAVPTLLAHAKQQYELAWKDDRHLKTPPNRRNSWLLRWRRMIKILSSSFIYKVPVFRTIYNLAIYRKKYGAERYWDLHEGNLMIRESTGDIVLTDPFV